VRFVFIGSTRLDALFQSGTFILERLYRHILALLRLLQFLDELLLSGNQLRDLLLMLVLLQGVFILHGYLLAENCVKRLLFVLAYFEVGLLLLLMREDGLQLLGVQVGSLEILYFLLV